MRTHRLLKVAALALVAALPNSGCVLIPELKDKIVQMVVGGSVEVPFTSTGKINNINETKTIDLTQEVDVAQILDDAGIDVSDVTDIKMSGASYIVLQPDAAADRTIVNGTVTAQRGSGPVTPIVTSFTETVNTVTSYKTAPIDPAGVTLINQMLSDYLTALKAGTTPTNMVITYTLTGQSTPSAPTGFTWQVKLDVSIVGNVEVTVVQ